MQQAYVCPQRLAFDQSRLQSHCQPPSILLDVYTSEPVIPAVVLTIFGSFLSRATGYDGSVSVDSNVQIGNLPRPILKCTGREPFNDLCFSAQFATQSDERIVVARHALERSS